MNSLMQRYYAPPGTGPLCAEAAAAAAVGRRVDGIVGCRDVDDAAATSSISRRHRHHLPPADHRTAGLAASYLQSAVDVPNAADCRHSHTMFADVPPRCASTRLSPLMPYESKFAPGASVAYGDYAQPMYDQHSALVADMNGHCAMYKVEQPSPSASPNSERRATDETWTPSGAHHVDQSNSELNISTAQTEAEHKSEVGTADKDLQASLDVVCQSTTSDDDSDDLEAAGSTSTKTSTTMTTAPEHHHHHHQQQQQHGSTNRSGDVRQTQQRAGVVLPIYPWMTRGHTTHGQFRSLRKHVTNNYVTTRSGVKLHCVPKNVHLLFFE